MNDREHVRKILTTSPTIMSTSLQLRHGGWHLNQCEEAPKTATTTTIKITTTTIIFVETSQSKNNSFIKKNRDVAHK